MSKRRRFVLDDRTNKLLEEQAADRVGNLEEIEQAPEFQLMMERSEDDIRAGRLVSHAAVRRQSRAKTQDK